MPLMIDASQTTNSQLSGEGQSKGSTWGLKGIEELLELDPIGNELDIHRMMAVELGA